MCILVTGDDLYIYFFVELPYNDYFEYFGPDFKLHISPTNMTNQNTRDYLNKIKARPFENLRLIPPPPRVQKQRRYVMGWDGHPA